MPKFVIEMDTENSTFKVTKDGVEIVPEFLSAGTYQYSDTDKEYYLSYGGMEDGMSVTRSVYFSNKNKEVYSSRDDNLCKVLASVVNDKRVGKNLGKALRK